MNGTALKKARLQKDWTQNHAANALGVTQAYLSMMEKGYRVVPEALVRKAVRVLDLPATALPLLSRARVESSLSRKHDFSGDLGALGYPGFAYLKGRVKRNPAGVLFDALNESNLDARVAEGLPWLAMTYSDMDWDWLVSNAKVNDRQNRLGFAVSLAAEVAEFKNDSERAHKLRNCLQVLEAARLAREDTFCHDSMTKAEREWLREHRAPVAVHWNLLTDMKRDDLAYASR